MLVNTASFAGLFLIYRITVHLSDVLQVDPLQQIVISGEGNLIRYLCRLLPASCVLHYEAGPNFTAIATTDVALDSCIAVLDAGCDRKGAAQFVNRAMAA